MNQRTNKSQPTRSQSVAGNVTQKKSNNTGLPDKLKSGIEGLSGYFMNDVKVHYNSGRPAQFQAHAFAQGNQIHLGPGQEKHLPHEAWHVVQQKQGRVRPTIQLKSSVPVNDDPGLEMEADVMGTKALAISNENSDFIQPSPQGKSGIEYPIQRKINHSSKDGYTANASRPGWLVHAEKAMLEEYNSFTEQTLEKVLYKKEKLARCHILSFDAIQTQVLNYLKGSKSANDFKAFVSNIIEGLGSDSEEYKNIDAALAVLQAAVSKPESGSAIAVLANKLLSLLNSLSINLRAADKYLNSFIQNRPDLVFTKDSSGVFHMSAYGKAILKLGVEITLPIPTSPGGTSVVTSQGKVPIGSMSPGSHDAVDGYAQESSKVQSENVSSRLQGSSAVSAFRTHEFEVDPRVLEALAKEREELLMIEKEHLSKYHELDKEIEGLNQYIEHVNKEEQERSLYLISELQGMEQHEGELSQHLHGLLGQLASLESELETIEDVFQRAQNHKHTIAYRALAAKGELTDEEHARKNLLESHSMVSAFLNGSKMSASHRAHILQLQAQIDALRHKLIQLEKDKEALRHDILKSRDHSSHKIDEMVARISHAKAFQVEIINEIDSVRGKITLLEAQLR